MNGKAARRIRRAAFNSVLAKRPVPENKRGSKWISEFRRTYLHLKRDYKLLPYHRRRDLPQGVKALSHRESERFYLAFRKQVAGLSVRVAT